MPNLFCERWGGWNSPYINHFLNADTVIPSYTNPQDLNRYSYVNNNPLRYTDPTGHMRVEEAGSKKGCSDPKYCQNGKPKLPSKKREASGKEGRSHDGGQGITFSYDSQEIANTLIPFTDSQWGQASKFLDKAALGVDTLAASIVLGHVAVGAAGGFSFEGNPVTGTTGAAAGYILGELNPAVRGLVGGGNVLASAATAAGVVQAEKSGDLRVTASLNIDQSGTHFSAHAHIAGSTAVSVGLTSAGLLAQPVSVSLPLQLLAVINDEKGSSLPSLDFNIAN